MVTAAAGHVASAYDIDMPLFQLMCDTDPESSAYAAGCPTPGALVSAFNAAFGATFDDGQMTQAKGLVAEALPLLAEGLGNLEESSLLPNNAASGPGLSLMRDMVQALAQSVDGGPVPLPHVSPALPVDLGAFFDSPKSPQQIDVPFLLYEQTCDDIECYDEVNANQAFFEQYFAESLQANWDGDYTFSDDAAVEATFEEFGKNVARYLVVDQ
jgi:hypothetical protein